MNKSTPAKPTTATNNITNSRNVTLPAISRSALTGITTTKHTATTHNTTVTNNITNDPIVLLEAGSQVAVPGMTIRITSPTAFDLRFGNPSSIAYPPRPRIGTVNTGYYSPVPDRDLRFGILVNNFTTTGKDAAPTPQFARSQMDLQTLSTLKGP